VEVIIIVWITYIYYIHKPLPCVSDILNGAVFCFISVFCEFFIFYYILFYPESFFYTLLCMTRDIVFVMIILFSPYFELFYAEMMDLFAVM